MKHLLLGLLLSLTGMAFADTTTKHIITLTEENHVSLQGEVTDESITKVILGIEKLKAQKIYLFIDSQGGGVLAGNRLIQYFATSEKKITCIAKVAISMAHQILQACEKRIGMTDNLLMQHRMTGGVSGNVDQMSGLIEALRKLELQLNTLSAKRIGISLEEFFKRVNNEFWTFGVESRKLNIVDEISHVKCDTSLYSKETAATVKVFIFTVPVLINGCPLVPVRIDNAKVEKNIPQEVLDKVILKVKLPDTAK